PQRLVGRSHQAGHRAGHLRGTPQWVRIAADGPSCTATVWLSVSGSTAYRLPEFSAARDASRVWRRARTGWGVVCPVSLAGMMLSILPVAHALIRSAHRAC